MHLDLALPGELTAATVNGKPVNVADMPTHRRQRFTLLYFGVPRGGVEVVLTLRGDGAISGTLADYSNGLPAIPGMTVTPRPAGFIPAPFDFRTRPPFTVELKFAPADRPRGPRRADPFTCSQVSTSARSVAQQGRRVPLLTRKGPT